MAKVLICTDWNAETQQCIAEAWVDQSVWVEYLPTVAQGHTVGLAFFIGLFSLSVVANLLRPPRDDG